MRGQAAKRDANERAIFKTWEDLGVYVEPLSGPGLPDALVHSQGGLFRAEVKGAKRGLTPAQVKSFTKAYEAGVPTFIIRTVTDAYALVNRTEHADTCKWKPEHGALAGAARKERAFRPGTDRARTLEECCKREGCATSCVTGSNPKRCAAHLADETFAP
jgi:hypothetical protein